MTIWGEKRQISSYAGLGTHKAGLHRAIASYVCNQVMRYPDARQDFRDTVQSSQPLVD